LRAESEIALKVGTDMPIRNAPWTAEAAFPFVAGAMPAYELIEDRHADYGETNAVSMIVENCWNGGVVISSPSPSAPGSVVGAFGRQMRNGAVVGEGVAEDPFATLAWLANQRAQRGQGITAGMVVITGSLIPTFSVEVGDQLVFAVEGLGEAVLDVT
jgi:2-keto-4-pentenoate hydratase